MTAATTDGPQMIRALPYAGRPGPARVLGECGQLTLRSLKHVFRDPASVGYLFAAPAVGAFLISLFSGWAMRVRRQGRAIVVSVCGWGAAITAFGFTHTLWFALLLLGVAGAADQVSAIFRSTIVLTVTPDHMRGRLGGIEFAQVASTPSLGNLEAGVVAQQHLDLLAGDGIAVLREIELHRGVDLPAGRGEGTGHRQDQADLQGLLRHGGCGQHPGGDQGRRDGPNGELHASPPRLFRWLGLLPLQGRDDARCVSF